MNNEVLGRLSASQARELQRLATSRRTPAYLSRRAKIVLEEHHARSTTQASARDVTRQTSKKWFERYLEFGVPGLEDAPRSGRPSSAHRSATDEILLAPLYAESLRWTSRSIAATTSTTQSAVARVWRRTYDSGVTALGSVLPRRGLELAGCHSDLSGSTIILREAPSRAGASTGTDFMRSPLRPALQTILAADILSKQSDRTPTNVPSQALGALLRATVDQSGATPSFVVCTAQSTADLATSLGAAARAVQVDRSSWQGLLRDLGPRLAPSAADGLAAAQVRAMQWASDRTEEFFWAQEPVDDGRTPQTRPRRPTTRLLATTDVVADTIVTTLVADISEGRVAGGDRITETHLTRSTYASRGQVRDALKVLASRGIIEFEPHRGAVMPRPSPDDVVETYAARRALGALIVRRAAETPLPGLVPRMEAALATMLETAKSGDALSTGEDDFQLQEVIAEMSGMRRVPAMFTSLTAQLRLFVAVHRIRYGYSIPDMCRDNIQLVQLIKERRGTDAVNRWNAKMNDAATYMLKQLDHVQPRHHPTH